MIASVAVSSAVYAIDKPYSYRIPDQMSVVSGMRVMVPFSRNNRQCEGLVLQIFSGDETGLKSLLCVLDDYPLLETEHIRMAAFLRERYFCTFYDAVKAMLPSGLWFSSNETLLLADTDAAPDITLIHMPEARVIMEAIIQAGGSLPLSSLRNLVPNSSDLSSAIKYLKKKKILQSDIELHLKSGNKTETVACLVVSGEQAMEYAARKRNSAPVQYQILRLLSAIGCGTTKEICQLTGSTMASLRRLEKIGLISICSRNVMRPAIPDSVSPADPIILNLEQKQIFNNLMEQSKKRKPGVALLYGVTGSGKTSVYIRLIQSVLQEGKSAIFLVPEISLTPQLLRILISYFGKNVAVLHSGLRISERADEWRRIRQGDASVVVGTRSAVFAPLPNLGLLIVDEEQEHTYKSENNPRYHAREVAIYRGNISNALVVLGSATPSLESMYCAKQGIYSLYSLPSRYNGKRLPSVCIVDMKEELKNGNASSVSRELCDALSQNIKCGHQSILFLNRRGASRYVICVECGNVAMCPNCSVSMTYHMSNHRMMCHHCGHSYPAANSCPSCGGHLKSVGAGTQRVQAELEKIFPDTPILRMDADVLTKKNSHESILNKFQSGAASILIGTQMITKGLNFEKVTLVGIIDADSTLFANHYRASETAFSLMTQVIGRSGRGSLPGRAIIQTMNPDHSVIRLAATQDYDHFYELEILLRQLQNAPPHCDVFSVTFLGLHSDHTINAAFSFRNKLENDILSLPISDIRPRVLGPAPAAIEKVNNIFRYCVTIHCENTRYFRQFLSHLLQEFARDKISKGITVFADINGYD